MGFNLFKLATLTVVASTLGLVSSVSADTLKGSGNGYQSSETDTFSGSGGFNPFDLIHQAQRGDVRSMGEFTTDAQTNIKTASFNFRAQQQLLLLQLLQQKKNNVSNQPAAELTPVNDPTTTTAITAETENVVGEELRLNGNNNLE